MRLMQYARPRHNSYILSRSYPVACFRFPDQLHEIDIFDGCCPFAIILKLGFIKCGINLNPLFENLIVIGARICKVCFREPLDPSHFCANQCLLIPCLREWCGGHCMPLLATFPMLHYLSAICVTKASQKYWHEILKNNIFDVKCRTDQKFLTDCIHWWRPMLRHGFQFFFLYEKVQVIRVLVNNLIFVLDMLLHV